MQLVDATCERCGRPIRWSANTGMVCTNCKPLTPAEAAIKVAEKITSLRAEETASVVAEAERILKGD